MTTVAEPATETRSFRERVLVRWVAEKYNQGWCTDFDSIMIRDLGYTADDVRAARGQMDYYHTATITFTAPNELNGTSRAGVTNSAKQYLHDYFGIEIANITGSSEFVSGPAALPTMNAIETERDRVLKAILASGTIGVTTQMTLLHNLGFTDADIRAARTHGYSYRMELAFHAQSMINDNNHLADGITGRLQSRDYTRATVLVTDCAIVPATVRGNPTPGSLTLSEESKRNKLTDEEFRAKVLRVFVDKARDRDLDRVMLDPALGYTQVELDAARNAGLNTFTYTVTISTNRITSEESARDYRRYVNSGVRDQLGLRERGRGGIDVITTELTNFTPAS